METRAEADRLQAVRGQLAKAAYVFEENYENQRYVTAQLTHRAGLVLQSTERAHEAVCAGMKRQRESTELVAKATKLQLLLTDRRLPPKKRSKCEQEIAHLLWSSRNLLARHESGQRQLDLANTGRKAAKDQYDQLVGFDKFVQSARWATLRPSMLQVPQLPPKPDLRRDLARLQERNE